MKTKVLNYIDFEKVNSLLEGFNKSTGFVTAILDLRGIVLSKSGWRRICTEFHRVNPETAKKCRISDTVLANKMAEGEKYHFYKCLNGLIDVAVPVIINGEHIANLFSGQFFFEKPDIPFFKNQAAEYGFDEKKYIEEIENVPVVSAEKVKTAMDFLLSMTQMICEMTFQKLEQTESNIKIIESEEKFKDVFESANVGKSITLPTGEIIVNQAFCDMLGYTREELQNKKWQDLTPEDEIPAIQAFTNSLFTGEKNAVRFEKRYICKDGSYTWTDVSVSVRPDDNGKPLHFITTVIDITDRKQAEENMQKQNVYTKMILDNFPIGIATNEIDSMKVTYMNRKFSEIYGWPEDDFHYVGDFFEKVFPDMEYRQKLQARILSDISSGDSERMNWDNLKITTKSGDQRIVYAHNIPLLSQKIMVSTVQDITKRKQAEDALRQSEEKFSIMFRKAPFSAALSSISDLKFVEVNEQFEKYWGYSSAEAIGKTSSELGLYPDENERFRLSAIFRESGFHRDIEIKMKSKSGELKDVLINSDIVKIGDEQYVLSTVQNITERKKIDFERYRFAMLADSSSEFIGMCDLNLQPIYVNPSGIRLVGLTDLAEACRVKVQDYFFPEDQRFIAEEFFPRVLSEGNGDIEIRLRNFQTGEPIWVSYYLFRVCDDKGQPVGWAMVSRNITERKQTEEKIRENNSLVRIAAEKAKLGGWNVDLKENRSYWSDEVAAIHEMPPGYAPLVEDGINFYAPEWRDRIIKVFTDCAGNGVSYDEEMEIITSTGKRVWIRTIGEAVRDENKQIFKVQGAFQDISEKKLAEAKVREKDLQFRKLSANVPDLLFQFTRKPDGSYCVPVASEGIVNIFGCTPEDVVDDFTPIAKVIYPDDSERVMADIEYSARNLTHFTCEFRVLIPGRPIQWILSRSSPEKLPDGSITWYGFNANITERKHAEEEINRQLDELQRWHQVTLGREGRILELKKEVNDLLQQHGEALRYGSTIPENPNVDSKV